MPQIYPVPKLFDVHIWGNMPIYLPHMKLLLLMMWPELPFTDDDDSTA